MTEFTLDKSGAVMMPRAFYHPAKSGEAPVTFSDLSPFAQGYVEALFASDIVDDDAEVPPLTLAKLKGFSDLSPAFLARIIRDCEQLWHLHGVPEFPADPANGVKFWHDRQAGTLSGFPPLRIFLNDQGQVDGEDAT